MTTKKCFYCGLKITGAVDQKWINGHYETVHFICPEITSGLGIGGVGSDDYSIHTEPVITETIQRPALGQYHVPNTGTTEGISAIGRCAQCGRSGSDFNPGAGRYLCSRHWDEY